MQNENTSSISKSLGFQIKKYAEEPKTQVLLLLSFKNREGEHNQSEKTVNQLVAFVAYSKKNLKTIGDSLPCDLIIDGLLILEGSQLDKISDIKKELESVQSIQRKLSSSFLTSSSNYYFYDEEENEFYQVVSSGDSSDNLAYKKGEEVEISEKDNYLDWFIIAGGFKFTKNNNSTMKQKIQIALKSYGYLSLNHSGQSWMLRSDLAGEGKVRLLKKGDISKTDKEFTDYTKHFLKYQIDHTAPCTPISKLPVVYADIQINFEDQIEETNTKEIGKGSLGYEYLDFMIYVNPSQIKTNLNTIVNRLVKELNYRQTTTSRILVNFENSSTPFYVDSCTKLTTSENEYTFDDRQLSFKKSRLATQNRSSNDLEKFRNVHYGIMDKVKTEKYSVRGDYIYFHYNQDNFIDEGWGCAYRSLQSIYSWFLLKGYTDKKVPSITEIQQTLVNIGDKKSKFVGSKGWIGSMEVSYVLQEFIGVDSKIISISSGAEVLSKVEEFKSHFEYFGTPIMIGGGVLAYTMLGISIDEDDIEQTKFLILDPHYKGSENWKTVTNSKKGGVWWKTSKLFLINHFYNFCCPIPSTV